MPAAAGASDVKKKASRREDLSSGDSSAAFGRGCRDAHVSHARAFVGAGGATRNAINLDQEDEEESDSDGGKEPSSDGEAEKGAIDPHTFGRCGSGLRLPHSPPLAGPRQRAEPRRHTKERTESGSSSLSYASAPVRRCIVGG